jgi:hypothetical protein
MGGHLLYAGVCCHMWAAIFIFVHGHVVSVRGRPFSYAGMSFSYMGLSFLGVGGCLLTWAVVFVHGWSSSYAGSCLWVI